ncbi:hypothetical protein [Sneathiella sp.]|jgi:hypothetical protein|uniref:hypothetical protein n=1 Tax=Sneathiella sp. TaxID=1964365 RepID=UPI0039E3D9C5
MAHYDHRPAYLGRLHVRFPGNYRPRSHKRDDATLLSQYKDTSNIRSKYKGDRSGRWSGYKTSGIPIFGEEGAAPRTAWSVGHVAARQKLEEKLRDDARQSATHPVQGVAAENSHALGHGDYGADHELSAPAASRAQNTEQLAIELAMREAARKLNHAAGIQNGQQSLVHAKITDVLHPKTGHLLVRRFKLIRREDEHDKEGTVVFDHLMDGERLHISKDEAFATGRKAHDALMYPNPQEAYRRRLPASYADKLPLLLGGKRAKRKGMGGVQAPEKRRLADHQSDVLAELQKNHRQLKRGRRRGYGAVPDRSGVNMVGPAFTDARFPTWGNWFPSTKTGQAALDTQRQWMQADLQGNGSDKDDFESSGSLPSSDASRLLHHVGILENKFGAHLGKAASTVQFPLDQRPNPAHATIMADQVRQNFDSRALGVEDHRQTLLTSAQAASKALRSLERDNPTSGTSLLTDDQQRILAAAYNYHCAITGDHRPTLC